MGSRVRERQDEEVALNLVEQHPIVFDLAVAKSGEVACERVVAVLWRKRLAPGEKIDNMPMSSKKSSASSASIFFSAASTRRWSGAMRG